MNAGSIEEARLLDYLLHSLVLRAHRGLSCNESYLEVAHSLERTGLQQGLLISPQVLENGTLLRIPHVTHQVKSRAFEASSSIHSQIVQFLHLVSLLGYEPPKNIHTLHCMALPMQCLIMHRLQLSEYLRNFFDFLSLDQGILRAKLFLFRFRRLL